jgi:hypothetical protein
MSPDHKTLVTNTAASASRLRKTLAEAKTVYRNETVRDALLDAQGYVRACERAVDALRGDLQLLREHRRQQRIEFVAGERLRIGLTAAELLQFDAAKRELEAAAHDCEQAIESVEQRQRVEQAEREKTDPVARSRAAVAARQAEYADKTGISARARPYIG